MTLIKALESGRRIRNLKSKNTTSHNWFISSSCGYSIDEVISDSWEVEESFEFLNPNVKYILITDGRPTTYKLICREDINKAFDRDLKVFLNNLGLWE